MVPANSGALEGVANVRFGSKADIAGRPRHVRFTPISGHQFGLAGNEHIR